MSSVNASYTHVYSRRVDLSGAVYNGSAETGFERCLIVRH